MAQRTFEIVSRPLVFNKESEDIFELFDAVVSCEHSDDMATNNTFDVELKSDYYRYQESVSYDQTGESDSTVGAVAGSKTAASIFTRTAGSWVVDQLIGFRAWIYNSSTDAGAWYDVTDNTTTTITVSGTITAGFNCVRLQAKTLVRNNFQIVPRLDFYGSFFQYVITKTVPVSGVFKFFGISVNAIKKNIDPEFFSVMGETSDNWGG